MNQTTRETREAGYQFSLPMAETIRLAVLAALRAHPEGLTAEEVQAATGYSLNSCRSRLTEAKSCGLVEVIGKRPSLRTGIAVAVWRAA
jgi:DNA-binding IclR family transcriptional regulator